MQANNLVAKSVGLKSLYSKVMLTSFDGVNTPELIHWYIAATNPAAS